MFQIGYPTAAKIMHDIKALDTVRGTPEHLQTRLRGELSATHDDFRLAEWPECTLEESVPCFYDRCFAMSIQPAAGPYPRKNENFHPMVRRFDRPEHLQGGGVVFPSLRMPDDLLDFFIGSAADYFISSPYGSDHKALRTMRLVSKGFKEHVDEAATHFFNNIFTIIKKAHKTERVEDILKARDEVLKTGLALLPLICDHQHPNILTWMRLRSGKSPIERPPPPPRKRKRALACVRMQSV